MNALLALARSLRRRGLLGTLERAVPVIEQGRNALSDRRFDRRHGTDTTGIVALSMVSIESENRSWGVQCQPTPVRFLRWALDHVPASGGFVDFGCGKGRALLLAAEKGFPSVTGVDFAAEFCRVARRNVERFGAQLGKRPNVEILHADAVDYQVRDDDTVFFFFNPFSEPVMKCVLENIAASLARKNRPAFLLYYKPVWEGMVERSSPFRRCLEHPRDPESVVVFANREGARSFFPPTATKELRVELAENVNPHDWEDLLEADPDATFFHTLAWGRQLARHQVRMKPLFLLARAEGALVGGLPFVRMDRRGFQVLASMPYGTYGGPLAFPSAPKETREALTRRFFELAGAPRAAFAELVDFTVQLDPGAFGTRCFDDETHLLDLAEGYEEVWKGMRSSCRNRIKKAEALGLVASRATTIEEYRSYHSMMAATCKRNRSPILYDTKFLEGLWWMRNPGVQMWLARDGAEIVAGKIFFAFKESILNWGVASREADPGNAHNLIHAKAIENAVREGRKVYNFGSSLGFPGIARFKESFGARPAPYRHLVSEKRWFPLLRRWSRNLG